MNKIPSQPGKQNNRQDDIILAEAWLALWTAEESGRLDTSKLDINVCNCHVWLNGQMPDAGQCSLVERLVRTIDRVRAITNELDIGEDTIGN